jgi:hypothetical protein
MSSIGAGKSSRLPKFHTLDVSARIDALEKAGFLTSETRVALEGRGLALEDANNMVENVLSTFGVPMVMSPFFPRKVKETCMVSGRYARILTAIGWQGVALNMTVNGKDYVVPMVLEEPSVVAAVGNVARMTRPEGFTARSDDPVMVIFKDWAALLNLCTQIGQIHLREVKDVGTARANKTSALLNADRTKLLAGGQGLSGRERGQKLSSLLKFCDN